MKLPKYVKDAIRKAGKHNEIAHRNNELVRKWLEENAPDEYWEDYLIDSLEQNIDGSEDLIKFIENDCELSSNKM